MSVFSISYKTNMGMNIIIVDDDQIIRMGIKKIVEKENQNYHVVDTLSDGAYALDVMKSRNDIDVIITDVRMPVMDGIQLIEEVRKFNNKVKIIVLSGFGDFQYVRRAFKDGAVDYLLKPVKRNEFLSLLQKLQQEIVQEKSDYENMELGNQVFLADVLQRLFSGDPIKKEAVYQKFHLDFNKKYQVIIVKKDYYYSEKYNWKEDKEKIECINDEIEEWLKQQQAYFIRQRNNNFVGLLFLEEELTEFTINRLSMQIREKCDEEVTISCGLGNVHIGMQEVALAYTEARKAIETRFYLGKNRCIKYKDIEEKSVDFEYDIESSVGKLMYTIELLDYVRTKKEVEQIFIDLSFMYAEKFRNYLINLIEILEIRVKDFEKAIKSNDIEYKLVIREIDTYKELLYYVLSIMKNVITYLEDEKCKKSMKRMELAKQFIQSNYMKTITLNDVADYVELNASYFSNLFKNEVGEKFSEYLLNVRMEKALILLKDPKNRIYEIGNMVGYEDPVSFGRAFKKKVGMTPKEYRKSVY